MRILILSPDVVLFVILLQLGRGLFFLRVIAEDSFEEAE